MYGRGPVAACLLALVAACSPGSSSAPNDDAPRQAAGSIVGDLGIGWVVGATVHVRSLLTEDAPPLAAIYVVSDASFRLALNIASQPLLLSVVDGSYREWSGNREVALETRHHLQARINYVAGEENRVNLTPFTTIAAGLAEQLQQSGTPSTQATDIANGVVSAWTNFDIHRTRPMYPESAVDARLSDEQRHGMLLAALSHAMGAADGAGVIGWVQHAYEDVRADGLLNGGGTRYSDLPAGFEPSVRWYRHEPALHMLRYALSVENNSGISAGDLLDYARQINNSESSLFGSQPPLPLDEDGPKITVLTPAENASVYGVFRCVVNVRDALQVMASELWLDGEPLATFADPQKGELLIDAGAYSAGLHLLTVKTRNLLGTEAEQTLPLRFVASDTRLLITAPGAQSQLRGEVLVSGVASGVPGLDSVALLLDENPLATTSELGTPQFNFDSLGYPDGEHHIRLHGTTIDHQYFDDEVTVWFDNTPPEVVDFSPAENGYYSGELNLSAEVIDSNFLRIQLWLDGVLLNSDTKNSMLSANVETKEILDGEHLVKLMAQDAAGNMLRVNKLVYFDNTPPLVSDFFPPDGTVVGEGQFNISARIEDMNLVDTEFWLDGNFYVKGGIPAYSFIVGKYLSPGEHTISTIATDAAGNVGTYQSSIVRR